jgi:hypothetical protein
MAQPFLIPPENEFRPLALNISARQLIPAE